MESNNLSNKDSVINSFILKLRLQKFENDQIKAEETLKVLEVVLSDEEITSVRTLIDSLSFVGTIIQSQMPWETTPCNIVQKVIKIVKDEYNALINVDAVNSYTHNFPQTKLSEFSSSNFDKEIKFSTLRVNILEVLTEQKAELEQCQELIALQGETKIHSDEIIMTCGYSPTVLAFLLKAAKKRRFHTIVAECAPKYDGHKMAKNLSSANIQTTVIQDSAIFPMMARINKVIIGCQTVFCNGGIKTFLGAASLACAAKYYSVPIYVCTPTYKFSMEMMEEINDFDSPLLIVPAEKESSVEGVNVAIAKFDCVPPEKVTSFITNNGGIAPSYVYRQVMELYHPATDDI